MSIAREGFTQESPLVIRAELPAGPPLDPMSTDHWAPFLRAMRASAESKTRSGHLTLAELAARGGFSSRAYVREVFEGIRPLTRKAADQFARMLDLSATEKKYLLLLLECEKDDPLLSKVKLDRFRKLISSRQQRRKVSVNCSQVTGRTFQVYAAVPERGMARSAEAIAQVAKLEVSAVVQEIQLMQERGWVLENSGQYHTADGHLIINELRSLEFLKTWYLEELQKARSLAAKDFAQKENLFVTFKFCVRNEARPAAAKDLRELLSSWVEKHSEGAGDEVMSLTTALL